MAELYIPNSIFLNNFENIFKNNTFDFSDGKVEISFHPSYFAMHPVGLAFYAALADGWTQNNVSREGILNYDIKSIPYFQRMNFFNSLGFNDPKEIVEHEESGRFIPVTRIRDANEMDDFMRNIDPLLHTERENSLIIKHVFSELIRNVLEHSVSSLGANVCACYIKRSNKISIGISDAGTGLMNSLKKYHKVNNCIEALELALTPGISGKTSRIGGTAENAGAGLFFTKCIAQATRNLFVVYSGNAYFKLKATPKNQFVLYNTNPKNDRCTLKDGVPNFNGTLVGIDINIDDTLLFKDLMTEIGKAYSLGLKQRKKDYYKRIKFT